MDEQFNTSILLYNYSRIVCDTSNMFYTDIQCSVLSTPVNGDIVSCSSGRGGVGYEGDTCSFTCNTGYELTGSDTRTCQSNGSWSGNIATCKRGVCLKLAVTEVCKL